MKKLSDATILAFSPDMILVHSTTLVPLDKPSFKSIITQDVLYETKKFIAINATLATIPTFANASGRAITPAPIAVPQTMLAAPINFCIILS
jgi:hypothetical protein